MPNWPWIHITTLPPLSRSPRDYSSYLSDRGTNYKPYMNTSEIFIYYTRNGDEKSTNLDNFQNLVSLLEQCGVIKNVYPGMLPSELNNKNLDNNSIKLTE